MTALSTIDLSHTTTDEPERVAENWELRPMRIIFTLFTERWRCYFVSPKKLLRYGRDGDCFVPPSPDHELAAKDRWFRVRNDMSDQETLETAIHEYTHAALPWLKEEWVKAFARDLAELLTKLGFHRKECDDGQ